MEQGETSRVSIGAMARALRGLLAIVKGEGKLYIPQSYKHQYLYLQENNGSLGHCQVSDYNSNYASGKVKHIWTIVSTVEQWLPYTALLSDVSQLVTRNPAPW